MTGCDVIQREDMDDIHPIPKSILRCRVSTRYLLILSTRQTRECVNVLA